MFPKPGKVTTLSLNLTSSADRDRQDTHIAHPDVPEKYFFLKIIGATLFTHQSSFLKHPTAHVGTKFANGGYMTIWSDQCVTMVHGGNVHILNFK